MGGVTVYYRVLTLAERACVRIKNINTQEEYLVDGEEIGFVANTNLELSIKIRDHLNKLKEKSPKDIVILIRGEPQEIPHSSGFYVWSAIFNIKLLNRDEQLAQPQAFGLNYSWPESVTHFGEDGELNYKCIKELWW